MTEKIAELISTTSDLVLLGQYLIEVNYTMNDLVTQMSQLNQKFSEVCDETVKKIDQMTSSQTSPPKGGGI